MPFAKRNFRIHLPAASYWKSIDDEYGESGFDVRNTLENEANPIESFATFQADVERVLASGATWIRLGCPLWVLGGWYGNENDGLGTWYPLPGRFEAITEQIKYAHSRGLKISFTSAQVLIDWDQTNNVPTNTFANFLEHNRVVFEEMAQQWGKWISVWQVLNEHDRSHYRSQLRLDPDPQTTPTTPPIAYWQEVRDFMVLMRNTIKSVAPHVLVTTAGSAWPGNETAWQHWTRFYDVVGSGCDILGVNIYTDYSGPDWAGNIPMQPGLLHQTESHFGKQVIVTETGYPGLFDGSVATGEARASATVPAQLDAFTGAPALATLPYQLRDRGTSTTDTEMRFGIYYNDGTPKSYRDAVAAYMPPRALGKGGVPGGRLVTLTAGAPAGESSFTWRIVSGGGSLGGTNGAVTALVAPSVASAADVVIGLTTGTAVEKFIRVRVVPA